MSTQEIGLRRVGFTTVSFKAMFDVANFFKKEDQPNGIKFFFGPLFERCFLSDCQMEINVPEVKLAIDKLDSGAFDSQIITKLGGESQATSRLAYMADLLIQQPQGKKGDLITDGCPNIFYMKGVEDKLMSVRCRWVADNDYWGIYAKFLSRNAPDRPWGADAQILSPLFES